MENQAYQALLLRVLCPLRLGTGFYSSLSSGFSVRPGTEQVLWKVVIWEEHEDPTASVAPSLPRTLAVRGAVHRVQQIWWDSGGSLPYSVSLATLPNVS